MVIIARKLILAALCAIAVLPLSPSQAQQGTELQLTYSKGQFQPSEPTNPSRFV